MKKECQCPAPGCTGKIRFSFTDQRASCENRKCGLYFALVFTPEIGELEANPDGTYQCHITGKITLTRIGRHGQNESIKPEWLSCPKTKEVASP